MGSIPNEYASLVVFTLVTIIIFISLKILNPLTNLLILNTENTTMEKTMHNIKLVITAIAMNIGAIGSSLLANGQSSGEALNQSFYLKHLMFEAT